MCPNTAWRPPTAPVRHNNLVSAVRRQVYEAVSCLVDAMYQIVDHIVWISDLSALLEFHQPRLLHIEHGVTTRVVHLGKLRHTTDPLWDNIVFDDVNDFPIAVKFSGLAVTEVDSAVEDTCTIALNTHITLRRLVYLALTTVIENVQQVERLDTKLDRSPPQTRHHGTVYFHASQRTFKLLCRLQVVHQRRALVRCHMALGKHELHAIP